MNAVKVTLIYPSTVRGRRSPQAKMAIERYHQKGMRAPKLCTVGTKEWARNSIPFFDTQSTWTDQGLPKTSFDVFKRKRMGIYRKVEIFIGNLWITVMSRLCRQSTSWHTCKQNTRGQWNMLRQPIRNVILQLIWLYEDFLSEWYISHWPAKKREHMKIWLSSFW